MPDQLTKGEPLPTGNFSSLGNALASPEPPLIYNDGATR